MNFRILSLMTVASAALMSGAVAADLPVRTPAPAPVFVAPSFSWAGFYAGLNAGGAWTTGCRSYDLLLQGVPVNGWSDECRSSKTLFTGGAQFGYNLQSGNLVYGLEADINAVGGGNDSSRDRQFGDGENTRNLLIRGVGEPSVYGTVRARLGLSADRALFYVTGGLAWAAGGNDPRVAVWNGTIANRTGDAGAIYSRDGRRDFGWTAGLGVEYAFTNNWTARIEYLYVDLGKEDNAWSCVGQGCVNANIDLAGRKDAHFNVVRVGVNYKFGGSSSNAVVARY